MDERFLFRLLSNCYVGLLEVSTKNRVWWDGISRKDNSHTELGEHDVLLRDTVYSTKYLIRSLSNDEREQLGGNVTFEVIKNDDANMYHTVCFSSFEDGFLFVMSEVLKYRIAKTFRE